MSILKEIVQQRREDLKLTKSRVPLAELKEHAGDCETPRPFRTAITRKQGEPIKLIAELKKASPSRGLIREGFDVQRIVSVYDTKPVNALSVLTEERYFQGHLDYLDQARSLTGKPLLRKDFIFDDYQVYESRAHGADAILLIAASLTRSQLDDLIGLAGELSLACLVEVHNLKELDTVLSTGADIIGINNRDLNTLRTSLDTTFHLMNDIPDDRVIVSESGIQTRQHIEAIESKGVDAILIGTTIMRSADIGKKIDELMGEET
jgi:indole-3-glycerol phosphate synthase